MESSGKVLLTKQMIEEGLSSKGGYNKKQLKILGVEWPPQKGWKSALIGTMISQKQYQNFLNAKK